MVFYLCFVVRATPAWEQATTISHTAINTLRLITRIFPPPYRYVRKEDLIVSKRNQVGGDMDAKEG